MDEAIEEKTKDLQYLSKEEIISHFKKLSDEKDISELIPLVNNIKSAFHQRVEERENKLFLAFKAKGGFPADFVPEKDPLDGYFQEVLNIFKERRKKFKEQKRDNEKNNLEAKQKIIEDLKKLIEEEHRIGKAFQEFKKLRENWNAIGKVASKKEKQLQHDYHFQVELFYYNIKINKDLKDLDLQKHLELKLELLKQMEMLLKEKTIKKIESQMRKFYDEWADIGPVPQEKKDEIITRFNKTSKAVYKKIKDHYKALREKQLENLEAKTSLCTKVETMNTQEIEGHRQWQTNTKTVLNIQDEWKKIGRATSEKNEDIWERFRDACNTFFEKKRTFYEGVKQDNDVNKVEKIKLCEKAEELAKKTDWETTTKEIVALQRQWKKTPPAHPKDESKLWKRFNSACDNFFTAKKDHHAALEERRKEHLVEKEAIIKKIESVKLTGNIQSDQQSIKLLIEEWNQIEEVPNKDVKRIYDKYTKALDSLYDQIEMPKEEKDQLRYKNKIERLAHSDSADQDLNKELKFLKGKVNEIESSIIQYENNLGFFAKSGKADFLKLEVEKNINKSKEELDFWKSKIKILKKIATKNNREIQ